MTARTILHDQVTCRIEISPIEVDAGANLTMRVWASCAHRCDLSEETVSIRSQDDTEIARAEFTHLEDEAWVTDEVVLAAPLRLGEHRYKVVLAAHEKDGAAHDEATTEVTFVVNAHAARVSTWGLPSAIAAGKRFGLKVGIKCSCGCKLCGRAFRILDHRGAQVAAGTLQDEPWRGTSALYFAEVDAEAPSEIGDYAWKVESPGSASGVAHAHGSCTFWVRVVGALDYEVTVVAIDSAKQSPIRGAHVLLHPYRALTDENGVAKIRVAKGSYKLNVSGLRFIPHQDVIDAVADVTLRAELAAEPARSPFFPQPLEIRR